MRYLLVGNYGVGNAGDEILRDYFLERFPKVNWCVCSARPQEGELARLPAGFRSFFSMKWIKTLRELWHCDGIVFGGGSLFTDDESVAACWIWFVHAFAAVILRKPIILAFQGIGPFRTMMGGWFARFVVQHAVFISTRDTYSTEIVSLWKKSTEVVQSFDPSFLLLERDNLTYGTNNVFTFIPRYSTRWSLILREKVVSILRDLTSRGWKVHILSLHPADSRERELCQSLSKSLGIPMQFTSSLREAVSLIAGSVCVLSQRYHSAVVALAGGIPFVALSLSNGDKLDSLARMCNCPSETLDSLTVETILETDWGEKKNGVISLRDQYVQLVEQGEAELRNVLRHYSQL